MNDEELQVVHYRTGYRHQLVRQYEQYVAGAGIFPVAPGGNEFVWLTIDGRLIIHVAYAWNGASGPAVNDKAFVRPSLFHDAACQLWELGVIDDAGRKAADKLLGRMLRDDMRIIAKRYPWYARWSLEALALVRPIWVVGAVRFYSKHLVKPEPDEILTAP